MIRAVGESPVVAHTIGYDVLQIRRYTTITGGALAGLSGAFIALVQFKAWQEGITSGMGWIAVALVVFATWNPVRLIAGALLFGLMRSIGFVIQGNSQHIQQWQETHSAPTQAIIGFATHIQVLNSLPYIATIAVLCWVSRDWRSIRMNAPMSLGQTYTPAK
jgi:general nucleoside transport system permease protein